MPDRVERAKFDDLYALVSAMLADGRYRPGDRIGLKDLASRLHVSVTPLREVLSRLVGCNIVTERRSEGYYLARFDARDIADLYRLHCACIERALAEAPGITFAVRSGDIWDTLCAIVEASGNTILSDVHRYLDGRLKLIRRAEIALLGDTEPFLIELLQTVIDQDLDVVRDKIRKIYEQRISMSPEIALFLGRRQ
ncbi:DNA-binding transcriptional regulator, GntR family [Sphingomonas sp. OK281]|nr:DNA-binding transcriptional regulator, GntR family [Sphingomonas sp. OK281]